VRRGLASISQLQEKESPHERRTPFLDAVGSLDEFVCLFVTRARQEQQNRWEGDDDPGVTFEDCVVGKKIR
jgi:hypothetical protein